VELGVRDDAVDVVEGQLGHAVSLVGLQARRLPLGRLRGDGQFSAAQAAGVGVMGRSSSS
jgi:hypothetical protein